MNVHSWLMVIKTLPGAWYIYIFALSPRFSIQINAFEWLSWRLGIMYPSARSALVQQPFLWEASVGGALGRRLFTTLASDCS